MRWLIVEDALRDRTGHWLEWVSTFYRGFLELGDDATVLADTAIQPDIRESLAALPILPHSIWHRMSDSSGPITRYSRFVTHAWRTWYVLAKYLKSNPAFDAIFVPTVAPHHLLAWFWLIKRTLRRRPTRVLLFFLAAPLRFAAEAGIGRPDGSPSAFIVSRLLRQLAPEVRAGRVILGVETEALLRSMERLTGVPFTLFPQPVKGVIPSSSRTDSDNGGIRMAAFGDVRTEKGSDILQNAILDFRRRFPDSDVRFTLQWVNDFVAEGGRVVSKHPHLLQDPCVRYITRYFADGEYTSSLQRTDAILLPYRLSSYGLRGSRVAIEAVVNGIPVVVTTGTTLAKVADSFGASIKVADGDTENLTASIREMEIKFADLREKARRLRPEAVKYFSVENFRRVFREVAMSPGAAQRIHATDYSPAAAAGPSPELFAAE